jgi:hypothetical protein
MRKLLTIILLFISASTIFFACQKNVSENQEPVTNNNKIAKAKAWFEAKTSLNEIAFLI